MPDHTTADKATAVNRAQAWKSRGYITDSDLKRVIASRRSQGKNFDVGRFLERQLSRGIGLGSNLVNKYTRGRYMSDQSLSPIRNLLGNPYGIETPNLAGMRGLTMQRGQVYMGAAQQGGPIRSYRNYGLVGLTRSGQPQRTANYIPILKLKQDFKSMSAV